MFYAVETVYRAGGNVSCHMFTVHSPVQPTDKEEETPFHVTVTKYFNDESEALNYARRFDTTIWTA